MAFIFFVEIKKKVAVISSNVVKRHSATVVVFVEEPFTKSVVVIRFEKNECRVFRERSNCAN